jgi:putative Mn2+ efflux pump MntP
VARFKNLGNTIVVCTNSLVSNILEEFLMPENKKQEFEPLEIMGLFWTVFGIIIILAAYFPPTWVGKITNIIAGSLLLGIGLIALLKGRANKRKQRL